MWLGLSVKLIGSCGKRCVWRNVDHACEKTQGLSNTVPMSPRIECLTLPEIITLIFFPALKHFPFSFLSHFWSDQVLKFWDPRSSVPPQCPGLPWMPCPSTPWYCSHALLKNLVFTCTLQIIWNKGFIPSFPSGVNLLSNCLILNSFLVVLQKPKAVCTLR